MRRMLLKVRNRWFFVVVCAMWSMQVCSNLHAPHYVCSLIEVFFQDAAGLWMAQLANGTLFNLTYTFTSHFQLLAYLFERMVVIINQSKAKFDNLPFTDGKLIKDFANLFAQQLLLGDFHWATVACIFDDISQGIFLFFGEGSIERKYFFGPDQQFADPIS